MMIGSSTILAQCLIDPISFTIDNHITRGERYKGDITD